MNLFCTLQLKSDGSTNELTSLEARDNKSDSSNTTGVTISLNNIGNIKCISTEVINIDSDIEEKGKENKDQNGNFEVDPPRPQKTLSSNPKFVIPLKILLKQMKMYTNSIEEHIKKRVLHVTRTSIRQRLITILEKKNYMPSKEIVNFYREHYPKATDESFVQMLLKEIGEGKYDNIENSDSDELDIGK